MILEINLRKISYNSASIVKMAQKNGLTVMGVTKGFLGEPKIAAAMKNGGINKFGDSRVQNIERLLSAGFKNLTLIRQPDKQEIKLIINKVSDIYVNTVYSAELISKQALKCNQVKKTGCKQNIVLLVETGDCRDGFLAEDLKKSLGKIKSLSGLKIKGIATNIACAKKVKTSLTQINEIVELANELGLSNVEISAANSSSISLLESADMPEGVTEIRVGEAITLGQETINFTPIKGLYQDAFVLCSRVLEASHKFGRSQVLLSLGKADIGAGTLKPYGFDGKYIRSTSDHTIISVKNIERFFTGQELKFIPDYYALLALMISPYIKKKYLVKSV